MEKIKLVYLLSHPIPYQTPVLKKLSSQEGLDFSVLYRSRKSLREHSWCKGYSPIKWDVSLLDGYKSKFLSCIGSDEGSTFFKPVNFGLYRELRNNEYNVLWVHGYSDFYSIYAIILAKILGIRVLVRGDSNLMMKNYGRIGKILRGYFFKILGYLVDGYLYIGKLNYEFYRSHGAPEEKLFFCPYSVENNAFTVDSPLGNINIKKIKSKLSLDEGRPIILSSGRMIPQKNQEDLLDAYFTLSLNGVDEPFPYLIFIGDGVCRKRLEKKAQSKNWSSILFMGFLNQSELPLYYALSDIFVMPSENEKWGIVVNEAMTAGCALVVSDNVACSTDLVQSSVNGFIYRVGDVIQLSDMLRKIIFTPGKWKELGRSSRIISFNWSVEMTVAGVMNACISCTRD